MATAAYDSDLGQLTIHGHIKQTSIQRVLSSLGILGDKSDPIWIDRIILTGNVHLYLDSLEGIELIASLSVVLSQNCSFILNVDTETMVLPEMVLILSGASKTYIYNQVHTAMIDMTGKTECIFQKPLHSFRVERIGLASHLQICGEKIERMMNRVWDEDHRTFVTDYYDALIQEAKEKLAASTKSSPKLPTDKEKASKVKKTKKPHLTLKPHGHLRALTKRPNRVLMASGSLSDEMTHEPIKPRSPSPEKSFSLSSSS